MSLEDRDAPARVLHALNALRKARQHYDVLLTAAGEEVAAHRAVLAASSPRLLTLLEPSSPAAASAPAVRVPGVDPDALRELVEYAYTGRLRVKDASSARRLYRAAAALRVEHARSHLADRLLRRLTPHDCLSLRALPDLADHHRSQLDTFIEKNVSTAHEHGRGRSRGPLDILIVAFRFPPCLISLVNSVDNRGTRTGGHTLM